MAATLDGRVQSSEAVFEAKFMLPWRRDPALFGIDPPRPRIEALRIVDMSTSNAWAEFADVFIRTREAHLEHEKAKAELKSSKQRLLIIAHDDPGVGAAYEIAPPDRSKLNGSGHMDPPLGRPRSRVKMHRN